MYPGLTLFTRIPTCNPALVTGNPYGLSDSSSRYTMPDDAMRLPDQVSDEVANTIQSEQTTKLLVFV